MTKGVRNCQIIGVDAMDKLVAHARDGADARLCTAVDSTPNAQRRQLFVQTVSCNTKAQIGRGELYS